MEENEEQLKDNEHLFQVSNVKVKPKRTIHVPSRLLLYLLTIGVWVLIIQNLWMTFKTQDVKVVEKVRVIGAVGVNGTVDVAGSVGVNNVVDINIAQINGDNEVFFNNPDRGHKDKYYRIPVITR